MLLLNFFMKIDLVQVGVGGTGGCLFTKLARFLAGTKFENVEITFRIIDGDFVEAKNLQRQPFADEDIGLNKAVALASAAEETLGVKVKAYPEYLKEENKSILQHDFSGSYYSSSEKNRNIRILVGGVDNHVCRKLLHEYFIKYNGYETLFYLDSANEISCGEIVIGKRNRREIISPDRAHYYPEILTDEGKAPYEMSCEELNQAAPQHLATNSLAADLMFAYIAQLLTAGDMAYMAPGGIVYFDAFKMFSRFDEYTEAIHGCIK